jgi:hypothetical protein
MKSSVFWDTRPCSPLKVDRRFAGIFRLHFRVRIICLLIAPALLVTYLHGGFLAYFSTLNMEATYSFETSVEIQLTTRRYTQEDETL